MKKLLYLLLLASITTTAQQIQWQKTFGGVHADYLYDAMPTLDYGFIMVGGSLSNKTGDVGASEGDFDYFITKVSEYGKLEWSTTLGGEKTDIIKSITNTYDGGYLVAGISNSNKINNKTVKNIGQFDIWLVKIDIKGTIEWQKTLGGLANEDINDVVKTKDGGYLIAGTSASETYYYTSRNEEKENPNCIFKKELNNGNLDYWLIKIDTDGNEKWQKTYGGKYKDELKKVVVLPNREIILAGTSNSPRSTTKQTLNLGLNDWWILKLTETGDSIWQKAFGNDGDDQLNALVLTNENEILISGNFRNKPDVTENTNPNSDFVVIKLDLEGEIIWENTYSQGVNDVLTDVVTNKDGSFLLSGYAAMEQKKIKNTTLKKLKIKRNPIAQKGTEDFLVLKINAAGEELWRKAIGTDKKEVLRKSIQTRDGGYVLMGSSMPLKASKNNDANFKIVKLLDKDKPIHKKLPLEAVPNPTSSYTSIVIGNDYKEGTVTVIDMAGRTLQTLKISGKRIIPIHLENYANGVYLINVKTNVEMNSVKVIKNSY